VVGRQHVDVGIGHLGGHLGGVEAAEEADPVAGDGLGEPAQARFGRAGADDHQFGVRPVEFGEGPHQDVHPFLRTQPAAGDDPDSPVGRIAATRGGGEQRVDSAGHNVAAAGEPGRGVDDAVDHVAGR